MRRLPAPAAVAALAAIAALSACSRRAALSPDPPVILISIDTLRADHLPAYGYGKVSTPAIDALRRDSILFSNASSHVPLTLPSHVSILTGRLPPASGVRDNTGFHLDPAIPTIASQLKSRGYATGAAVSCVVLTGASGIRRGFDFYEDNVESLAPGASAGDIQRSGAETERLSELWLRNAPSKTFFFLHLYEPHTPYAPPEPYRTRYASSPYDGEIAAADAVVGKFVAFLKEKELYDGAAIFLLSDHGEGLGDHGEDEHGILLYRETVHVPLLVKLPGARRAGSTVDRPVGLADVFPTALEIAGAPASSGISGVSLLSDAPALGDRSIYSETMYPRYHYGWRELAALTNAAFEYIHAAPDELYDLRADPAQTKNLAPSLPPAFRSLRNALLGMDRQLGQVPGASDPEQLRKLQSLGYLGTTQAPSGRTDLPNPVDHVEEVRSLRKASATVERGDVDEGIRELRRIVIRNPDMIDAWAQLANVLHRAGRNPEALTALREVDRRMPGSALVLQTMSNVYLAMGDLASAERSARQALAVSESPVTRTNLAHILAEKGDFDGAEREARLVLASQPGRLLPRLVLAVVARKRGDAEGALRELDAIRAATAAAGAPPMSSVDFQRAEIFAAQNRTEEAEAAYREEIAHYPAGLAAWQGLALLLAKEGRLVPAATVLKQMADTSPNPRARGVAAALWSQMSRGAAAPSR